MPRPRAAIGRCSGAGRRWRASPEAVCRSDWTCFGPSRRPGRSSPPPPSSRTGSSSGSDDGNLYALALADGKKVWDFKTGGAVESSPLVLEGKVFVGSSDAFLYALEAATGKLVWKYETGDKILGGPNWVKSGEKTWVLAGSYDFKLHCLDAATGRSNWVYETGNYINGSPAVANGQTVFGGCDGLLHVISLADGKQVKEVEAGAYIPARWPWRTGAPISASTKMSSSAWICRPARGPGRSATGISLTFFPGGDHEVVVFGGRDKLLHCVKREDGLPLWSFATRGKVDSSPVICGNKVVVGSDDGRLYVVSLDKGKELWSYEVGQPIESSPAVARAKIVVGCDDGNVYCFGGGK